VAGAKWKKDKEKLRKKPEGWVIIMIDVWFCGCGIRFGSPSTMPHGITNIYCILVPALIALGNPGCVGL
jgi:hypothetical protein